MKKTKVDQHQAICKMLTDVYKAKNADYGDSFGQSFQEWGAISAVVRMDDKMRRIKQLLKNEGNAKVDESLTDSVADLANYSIMLLMELMKGGENQ